MKDIIKPIAVLGAICLVVTALLLKLFGADKILDEPQTPFINSIEFTLAV